MANLTDSGRRGQIILVTGFALAVVFVGLALVLNSVIYTENLATRAEITTEDPIQHTTTMNAGTEEILEYINEYNTSQTTDYPALEDNLSVAFGNLTAGITQHQLSNGQVTNDTLTTIHNGTWIKQDDETRAFRNETGAGNWELVADASGARSLRIFVNNPSILGSFKVEAIGSAGDRWTLTIGSTVDVDNANGNTFSCGSSLNSLSGFWVNVSEGTVDGDDCGGLNFGGGLEHIESITFSDGGQIEGTYRLMVNKSEGDILPSTDYGTPPNDPFTEPALYGTNVNIEFARKNLFYRTEITVIPGEKDGS